jgi:hypothetical protein
MSVLLEHKRQAEAIMDAKSNADATSLRRQDCMQDAIKDIDEPWGARAALKEVEAQCQHIPTSALATQRSMFIVITSTLFTLLLIDIVNSGLDEHFDANVAITMTAIAFVMFVFFSWICGKKKMYVNRKAFPRRAAIG